MKNSTSEHQISCEWPNFFCFYTLNINLRKQKIVIVSRKVILKTKKKSENAWTWKGPQANFFYCFYNQYNYNTIFFLLQMSFWYLYFIYFGQNSIDEIRKWLFKIKYRIIVYDNIFWICHLFLFNFIIVGI